MTTPQRLTGGCQCGAVRFSCEGLGRASVCHCRMCQKAMGGFFGPFVTAQGLDWTRGEPARFQSSNLARRGFCRDCGTPLTFEVGAFVDIAIGAFDDAHRIMPAIQLGLADRHPAVEGLAGVPTGSQADEAAFADRFARVVSLQHPDRNTDPWPPR